MCWPRSVSWANGRAWSSSTHDEGRPAWSKGQGLLAGWLPDDRTYVTVEILTKKVPNPNPEIVTGTTVTSGVRVHLVRVSGGGTVVDLRPRRDWLPRAEFSQWSWAVSPDGRTLLAASGGFGSNDALTLRRFRLSDGREIGVERVVTDGHFSCSVGWVDASTVSVPIVDARLRAGRVLVDLRSGRSRTATVVSSHVDKDGGCLEESSLALAGPAVSGGLLGLSGVTWALWLLAVFAAVTFVVVRRRRRA